MTPIPETLASRRPRTDTDPCFDVEAFGRAIRAIRTSRHETLGGVSAATGVAASTVSRIERADGDDWSVQTVARLAVWAGLAVDPFVPDMDGDDGR